jgi:rSAM/selenodomain-associated transferase 2
VLDEGLRIGAQLDRLAETPGLCEILVVDGGSSDQTVAEVAARPAVRLLTSARGRARQMNAGAAAARGQVLLFLHADVTLPDDAACWIARTLIEPGVVAGAFRTMTIAESGRRFPGPLLRLADLRSRYSGLPYGDQALFVRTRAFAAVGGFPELPLMEDLELSRRLRRLGRIEIVPARVAVSGRRFEAQPILQTLLVNLFPTLYRLGVPPRLLAALYRDPR